MYEVSTKSPYSRIEHVTRLPDEIFLSASYQKELAELRNGEYVSTLVGVRYVSEAKRCPLCGKKL